MEFLPIPPLFCFVMRYVVPAFSRNRDIRAIECHDSG